MRTAATGTKRTPSAPDDGARLRKSPATRVCANRVARCRSQVSSRCHSSRSAASRSNRARVFSSTSVYGRPSRRVSCRTGSSCRSMNWWITCRLACAIGHSMCFWSGASRNSASLVSSAPAMAAGRGTVQSVAARAGCARRSPSTFRQCARSGTRPGRAAPSSRLRAAAACRTASGNCGGQLGAHSTPTMRCCNPCNRASPAPRINPSIAPPVAARALTRALPGCAPAAAMCRRSQSQRCSISTAASAVPFGTAAVLQACVSAGSVCPRKASCSTAVPGCNSAAQCSRRWMHQGRPWRASRSSSFGALSGVRCCSENGASSTAATSASSRRAAIGSVAFSKALLANRRADRSQKGCTSRAWASACVASPAASRSPICSTAQAGDCRARMTNARLRGHITTAAR